MSVPNNYGFTGAVPINVSVENNVRAAQDFQRTHSPAETVDWFYEHVRNNLDGHLPPDQSMDYK